MKTLYKKIIFSVTLVALFSSCLSDLDKTPIDPNVVQIVDQDALFTKIYGTLGLTGSQGPDGMGDVAGIDEGTSSFYRMMWTLNEFGSDEGWWVWADAGVENIRNHSWDSSNDLVRGLYARLYFDINLCNFYLNEFEKKTDDKSEKQKAEVRFLRALNYYYLLDMYGEGVPFAKGIIDKVPVEESQLPDPISRKDLFSWIESELKDIETKVYVIGEKPSYYRIDQAAVWMLLSRLYLNAEVYTGTTKWDEAADYAGKVMSSSYTLAPNYKHIFMGDNDKYSGVNQAYKEIILPIAQDGAHTRSWGGSMFLIAATRVNGMSPSGSTDQWECYRSKSNLVKKFFPNLAVASTIKADVNTMPGFAGDDRCLLESYVNTEGKEYAPTLGGGAKNGSEGFLLGWGIAKFSNIFANGEASSDTQFPDTDIPFLRASEAYLTYAEAVLRGATPTNGTALDAVNALRNRANATPWSAVDLTLENLLDEWGREFYNEGRRRTDLIRFNKFAGNVNYNWEGKGGSAEGKNIDVKYNIYPIPMNDLVANKKLKPSEGY
ncbi:MAG: RagB/SusD family nutrient uptake outer membrane protein [Porphyromonadaceae bacterium]|nr:RagB/SusD family nutrient uptake outer membrane protein [Porphyromonadaceae bacterium]